MTFSMKSPLARNDEYIIAARNLARLIERISLDATSKVGTDLRCDAVGLCEVLRWAFSDEGWKVLEAEPSIKETLATTCVSVEP